MFNNITHMDLDFALIGPIWVYKIISIINISFNLSTDFGCKYLHIITSHGSLHVHILFLIYPLSKVYGRVKGP